MYSDMLCENVTITDLLVPQTEHFLHIDNQSPSRILQKACNEEKCINQLFFLDNYYACELLGTISDNKIFSC